MLEIVYETHSLSDDNERGVASRWHHSRLSVGGRALAAELGARRRREGIAAVLSSDLRRARETAEIAFGDGSVPILFDWRLRECDYGDFNGAPSAAHQRDRAHYIDEAYPGGESWRQATARVAGALDDFVDRWDGSRVLIIGHVATRWALDHHVEGIALEQLAAEEFRWQEGWEYRIEEGR